MSEENLPTGWATACIEDLISHGGVFIDGDWVESKDQDPNGEVRLIQLADIGDGTFQNKSSRFLTREAAARLRCTFLKRNDLLIARMPDPLGRACVFPLEGDEKFVTVVDVCIIRTSAEVASPEFLRSAINFLGTRKQIEDLQTGTTRKRISRGNLASVTIPLPPLAEQKRIVSKIEELFSELDAGEESLRRARRQLGVYRQSLLKQAFEGKLTAPWRKQNPHLLESPDQLLARIQTERQACYQQQFKEWEKAVKDWEKGGEEANRPSKPREPESPTRLSPEEIDELVELPRGWCWMTLESLSSPEPRSIQSGPFGSSLKHEEFSNEGILVIGIDNVQKGYFSSGSQNRISPAKYRELAKYTARPKDFLITVMATVGRCCRIPDEIETAIITKHVYRVSPNLGLIDPDYLVNAALGCPAIVLQIEKDKFGQTRPGLNGGFIKALPVPLCTLPEQQEIVRLLDEQFEVIEQNEREIDAALKRSEALRQSILKKAFTGQLVPRDPTDEPASALLERIRKERETASEKCKTVDKGRRPIRERRGR